MERPKRGRETGMESKLKSSEGEREMSLYDAVCRSRSRSALDSYYVACEAFSEQQQLLRLSFSVPIGVKIKYLL
ncbi:hypothetical protein ACOSP7_024706 [Xanthoceras sorbifolium]